MNCSNHAEFGVTTDTCKLAACAVHLPDALRHGGYVQPLLSGGFTCQLPRKLPFGFSKENR